MRSYIIAAAISPLMFLAHAGDDAERLKNGLDRNFEQFKRTTVLRHPKDRSIFAANLESDLMWWGDFRVFHRTGDKIDWIASVPSEYAEWRGHYIRSLQWVYLQNIDLPVLEVCTSTHMGNGLLWLFALEETKLRTLLVTEASGFAGPSSVLDGFAANWAKFVAPLAIEYVVLKGEQFESVQLTGVIAFEHPDLGTQLGEKAVRMFWEWNPKTRVFDFSAP